jgi:hypothetical protein
MVIAKGAHHGTAWILILTFGKRAREPRARQSSMHCFGQILRTHGRPAKTPELLLV